MADICSSVEGLVRLISEQRSQDKSSKVADKESHSELLLEATIALLSVDDDSVPVKGVREAIKRFWHVAFHSIELTKDFLDTLVGHIVNGISDSSRVEDDEIVGDEENSDEEDMKEEQEAIEGTESESADEEGMDDVEPDDVDTSADDALVDMINLRKNLRKNGALEAKRKELIMNARYIDLLDVRASKMYVPTVTNS